MFSEVSSVDPLLETMINKVVSGVIDCKHERQSSGSIFEMNLTESFGEKLFFRALKRASGPKIDPPIPTCTTVSKGFPVELR